MAAQSPHEPRDDTGREIHHLNCVLDWDTLQNQHVAITVSDFDPTWTNYQPYMTQPESVTSHWWDIKITTLMIHGIRWVLDQCRPAMDGISPAATRHHMLSRYSCCWARKWTWTPSSGGRMNNHWLASLSVWITFVYCLRSTANLLLSKTPLLGTLYTANAKSMWFGPRNIFSNIIWGFLPQFSLLFGTLGDITARTQWDWLRSRKIPAFVILVSVTRFHNHRF